MNIIQVYKKYPTQKDCLALLELIRWKNKPICPYCKSPNCTPMPKENRYHCNSCNTSFSVTVGTIFHKTKVDLQKWLLAISIILNAKKGISARQLARDLEVNKNTAWYMQMRIRKAMFEQRDLFEGIIEADETYIGGKNKNKHKDKKIKGSQGRNSKDKTPVFGILERDGKIRAIKVNDVTSKTLKRFITENVKKGPNIITDDWKSYNGLDKKYQHMIIAHCKGEYVNGIAHTNTIEGFWSLLKRGITGQYHYVTKKYLNRYVDEFCYRYNNRENNEVFNLTIELALGRK
jgi:transposase-like protein